MNILQLQTKLETPVNEGLGTAPIVALLNEPSLEVGSTYHELSEVE